MSTLVLYDTTGDYGWLGEIYGIMTANLASHFGSWTAQPVVRYLAGQMAQAKAVIYIGSTYGEPIPSAFLADVQTYQNTPVIWLYDNIWQLTAATPGFQANYGWTWTAFDVSAVAQVNYKGQALSRVATNGGGIMNCTALAAPAAALAQAVRPDGSTFPWAVRSRNLTYIGEIPLSSIAEGDRYLAFCDLLFDALAPGTRPEQRALVRLEDIGPDDDPAPLYGITDYLAGENVPFGFQIIPLFVDPLGYRTNGVPTTIHLSQAPGLIAAINYMQANGGVMVGHGWTHQYSNVPNPYAAVSGGDAEFFRETLNPDQTLNYVGPVAEDSDPHWVSGRLDSAESEYAAAGLDPPSIWTTPNYAASAHASRVFARRFDARAERPLYFKGLLSGGAIDYTRLAGQYFPYTVRDVYGGKVLPDTLGGITPLPFGTAPARPPAQIVADAQRNLVVRRACASFYVHANASLADLQATVGGIKALGYRFVGPDSL